MVVMVVQLCHTPCQLVVALVEASTSASLPVLIERSPSHLTAVVWWNCLLSCFPLIKVVTFDDFGVSGHTNHRAVHVAIQKLLDTESLGNEGGVCGGVKDYSSTG